MSPELLLDVQTFRPLHDIIRWLTFFSKGWLLAASKMNMRPGTILPPRSKQTHKLWFRLNRFEKTRRERESATFLMRQLG